MECFGFYLHPMDECVYVLSTENGLHICPLFMKPCLDVPDKDCVCEGEDDG